MDQSRPSQKESIAQKGACLQTARECNSKTLQACMPEALLCFCLQNVYPCVDLITNARNANVLLPWPTASMSFVGHSIASVIKQFAKILPQIWNPNIFCRKFDVLLWLISHGSHMLRNWERSGACSWTRTERAQCHQEEICSYFSPQLQPNPSVIVCVCVTCEVREVAKCGKMNITTWPSFGERHGPLPRIHDVLTVPLHNPRWVVVRTLAPKDCSCYFTSSGRFGRSDLVLLR